MNPITLFSWGYKGWGTCARQLVKAVDAVEENRGFEPPVFVEVRLQRSGRAVDFQGDGFERLLGPNRYRWMKSLGNANISNPKLRHLIKIADPKSATSLLELAVDEAANERRIIFFCRCECPMHGPKIGCHRTSVAKLVLKAAKKSGIGIEIVEWPGEHPTERKMPVSADIFRKVRNGRQTIPLKRGTDLAEVAGLPWGSIVTLESDGECLHRLSGPAVYKKGKWCLPVVYWSPGHEFSLREIKRESVDARKWYGYEPRKSS